jgi:hypothetical protein
MTRSHAESVRAEAHADKSKTYDSLVPDAIAKAELGNVSAMTWWRWQRDAHLAALNFPIAVNLNGRTYRSRLQLEAFKQRLMQEAITARSAPQRRGPKARERT